MRLRVFKRLDVVVDLYRDDARLVGNVTADHQHDAEFSDGVGEAEDGQRQHQRQGNQRADDDCSIFSSNEASSIPGAIQSGSFSKFATHLSDPKQQVDMACLPCDDPAGHWSPTRDLASYVMAAHAAPRRKFSPRSGMH